MTDTETTGLMITVMADVALCPPAEAVIVARPAATPVTSPVPSTVATAVLPLGQVTATDTALPTLSFAVAVSGVFSLTGTVSAAGVTALRGRAFNRARRRDSLCKKVIASPASWSEELGHVRRAARGTGECAHAQPLQYQPQRALMLVNRGRLVAAFRLRAHHDPLDFPTTVRVVASRLVERDDQEPILLERRAADQWADIVAEPPVRRAQRAVVRVVAQIGHDVREA